MSYYYKLMNDWLFIKDGNESHKYAIGGLRYRGNYTLKRVSEMEVGETILMYDYKLTRIK